MQVEFCDETFGSESVQRKNLAVGRSGRWHLRTPSRTLSQLPTFACAASPPCPQQWGANLTIPACPCAQEASSPSLLSIPFGRPRRWLLLVRPAARCARLGRRFRVVSPLRSAAGPRAISLTAADHLGWLDCLLVINFLIVPASWLVRFALFVEVSGCVLSLSRVTSVSEFW